MPDHVWQNESHVVCYASSFRGFRLGSLGTKCGRRDKNSEESNIILHYLTSKSSMNLSIFPVLSTVNMVWPTLSACLQLWYFTGR